ncbi:hypothetical protein G3576_11845 [Roseomonas stagni]|uniref:Uncharacterized protein n=1 Tax=Falsiroseomonas algicola TaxID=2716930 RepID=A0A6M1LKI1_9PROT|nr:hypothetical protein [Falsiroseomonas algicola]NGM20707.1 hypothetical protein [Falsiroseomonas algicola]
MDIFDAITVVHAPGRRFAKLIHANGIVEAQQRTRTVNLHTLQLPGLWALATLLEEFEQRPDMCVVRGAILDADRAHAVRRLLHRDPKTGEAPTLREVPRRWIALDVDSLPVPEGMDPADLEANARAILPLLPAPFRVAKLVVQATASHGIKPGARLRLWGWCNRPVTSAECKAWLAAAPVDRSLYSAVQPHYTAAPVFVGWADHLPRRLAFLEGLEEVVVPPAPLLAPSPPPPAATALRRPGRLYSGGEVMRFARLLRVVQDAVEGERHRLLFWASCRAGELVAAGILDETTAHAALVQAAMDGGGKDRRNAEATARDGIARGAAEAGA